MVDLEICESNYLQTVSFEDLCSFRIVFKVLFCEMLRAIQFNDESSGCAVEVYDIGFYDALFLILIG